jgi:hypothetical protein
LIRFLLSQQSNTIKAFSADRLGKAAGHFRHCRWVVISCSFRLRRVSTWPPITGKPPMTIRQAILRITSGLIGLLLFTTTVEARIDFKALQETRIDLETLKFEKAQFFGHVTQTIKEKAFGLGTYGRVPFHPCDMEYDGLRLNEYQNLRGVSLRFISNPSCNQTVIQLLLEQHYQYRPQALSSYQNRQCMLSLEKIFSPMLEYYTIRYEERTLENCDHCGRQEMDRLNKIAAQQRQITQHCRQEADKVMSLLQELDEVINQAFRQKETTPP